MVELDKYFITNKLVRMASDSNMKNEDKITLPILHECMLNKLILTIYIMKHWRGNVIPKKTINNKTIDL